LKRSALIKDLVEGGCYLKRRGSKHDIYANAQNGKQAPIPRHAEIEDSLVRLIKKQLSI